MNLSTPTPWRRDGTSTYDLTDWCDETPEAVLLGAVCLLAPAAAMWGTRARPAMHPVAIGLVAAVVGTLALSHWPPTYLQVVVFLLTILGPAVSGARKQLVMPQYHQRVR